MAKIGTWFFLSCKRYGMRFSFLMTLLILPIGAMLVGSRQEEADSGIRIALSTQGEDPLADQLVEHLVNRSLGEATGMFQFYRCEDEEKVRSEVASRRAECGYVIYEGFQEKMDRGNIRRSIGVYSAPSTVAAELSTETVLAALMELYDRQILENYIGEGEVFESLGLPGTPERMKGIEEGGRLYDRRLRDGSTFRFEYSYLGQEKKEGVPSQGSSVFPVRGMVAVYLFVISLYGGVVLGEDERRGLFLPLTYGYRSVCALASLAAPVFMAAGASLLALWMEGGFQSPLREFGAMAVYCLVLIAISWILKRITVKPQVLCSIIPFFTIGSFLFCPVFIDGGRMIEGLDQVGRFFPVWYYLNFFHR